MRSIVNWLREASDEYGMGRCDEAADDIERLNAENARLREALASSKSWIDRWTKHVGNCSGSDETCTCGRTAIIFEASAALAEKEKADG